MRRYWWLVLIIVLISVSAAAASTLNTSLSYTARSSLIVSSNNRAPEQDAVLVQGYAVYFNDGAYQDKLRTIIPLSGNASITARAAAASPILLVDATATSEGDARSAATGAAKAFRDEINRVHKDKNAEQISSLERRLTDAQNAQKLGSSSGQSSISDLESQILQIQDDQVNMLQELQFSGGVSKQQPSLLLNILLSLAGGLIIGVLAALGAAGLSNRVYSQRDVTRQIGLNTLMAVQRADTANGLRRRHAQLRQLASLVADQVPEPRVVAVTQAGRGAGATTVAWGLARQLALQGHSTLLVRAGTGWRDAGASGKNVLAVADRSADAGRGPAVATTWKGPVAGMSVSTHMDALTGGESELDTQTAREALVRATEFAAFVIVEAPPVARSSEAQVLCTAAQATLLVVERSTTRTVEAVEAVSELEQTNSPVLGVVLFESGRADNRGETSGFEEGGVDLGHHRRHDRGYSNKSDLKQASSATS